MAQSILLRYKFSAFNNCSLVSHDPPYIVLFSMLVDWNRVIDFYRLPIFVDWLLSTTIDNDRLLWIIEIIDMKNSFICTLNVKNALYEQLAFIFLSPVTLLSCCFVMCQKKSSLGSIAFCSTTSFAILVCFFFLILAFWMRTYFVFERKFMRPKLLWQIYVTGFFIKVQTPLLRA